ncbi:HAMP domain-containing sensor histidine kinase [Hamadaea sp. NPDC050747]|uniref:sensor histidine kinase n=1 Tax=Hamadaea sp. NPDC050747 TaxID=3155789 RepID=UPI0033F11DDB
MKSLFRRWTPGSLRGRITAVYLVALVVTLTGFGVVGSLLFVGDLRQGDTDEVTARVGDLAAAVRAGDLTPVEQDPYAQVIDGARVTARSSAAPAAPVLDAAELSEARQDKLVVHKNVPGLGDDAVLVATPLPEGRVAVAGASLDTVNTAARRLITGLALGLPILLALLTLGVRRLLGSALRPVAGLTAEAQEISTADPGRRLPVPPGEDEIASLARTLNGMLDRIAAATKRERTFLDAAAHELRTPVAALRAELELGLAGGQEQAREALRGGLREADRLARLTADMLTLARARAGQLPLERLPTDVTDRVRATAGRVAGAYPLRLRVVGEELVADVDPVRLDQVVTNLVANAAQAGAGQVTVGVRGEPPATVVITVDDDGPGFPAAMLPVQFPEPGSVPRHDSSGTGLGLTIVDMIARVHAGSVGAANTSPLGGAHVEVRLPAPPDSGRDLSDSA